MAHAPWVRSAAGAAHVCFAGDKERGSLRKTDMVRRMAEERGGTLVQEDEAVAATLVTIKEALQQGIRMKLSADSLHEDEGFALVLQTVT